MIMRLSSPFLCKISTNRNLNFITFFKYDFTITKSIVLDIRLSYTMCSYVCNLPSRQISYVQIHWLISCLWQAKNLTHFLGGDCVAILQYTNKLH